MTIQPFIRNRFTLSAYILLGFYAYMQTSLGPIMPFVREELSLNYTVTGLHLTAYAIGMVISGLTGAAVAQRIGRKRLFWGGGMFMCVGSILLMTASIAPLTIAGAFFMGWTGSYLLVMIQSTLADEHQDNSAIALTESNIIASILAACVPILVGLGTTLDLTWRFATITGICIWISIFIINYKITFPRYHIDETDTTSTKKLPRQFWFYWVIVFLGVALEWCMLFWSADFLEKVVGLPTEEAATMTSIFLFAIIIGRVVASRLTRRFTPTNLLWGAIGLIAVGFPLFWLGQIQLLNIIGLFVVGLGIANLFPLGLSIASRVGGRASDLASSRVSLAAGLAILLIPQVLGSTADIVGIFNAYLIVPIFLVALAIMLAIASRQN